LPERKLVEDCAHIPMANVIFGIAAVEGAIVDVSLSRARSGPKSRAFVDGVSPSIGVSHVQAAAEALRQACLQAIVYGIGVCQLIECAAENCAAIGRVLRVAEVVTAAQIGVAGAGCRRDYGVILLAAVQ